MQDAGFVGFMFVAVVAAINIKVLVQVLTKVDKIDRIDQKLDELKLCIEELGLLKRDR